MAVLSIAANCCRRTQMRKLVNWVSTHNLKRTAFHCSKNISTKHLLRGFVCFCLVTWPQSCGRDSLYQSVVIIVYVHQLYLEVTKLKKYSSSLKVVFQVILVTLAFICCLSRITDNSRHWDDILCGAILGATSALYIVARASPHCMYSIPTWCFVLLGAQIPVLFWYGSEVHS